MSAQTSLIAVYGEPTHDYIISDCILWEVQQEFPWFPVKRFLVNKDFKTKLSAAFKDLEAKGLHKEIKTFDGCYNDRKVRGRDTLSVHAWAAAIDLNASAEALGQATTHFTPAFIQTVKSHGIFWGGDWIHRKDPMHFALFNG